MRPRSYSRGPRFGDWHPSSQLHVTSVPGDLAPSSGHGGQLHTCGIHSQKHIIYVNTILKHIMIKNKIKMEKVYMYRDGKMSFGSH